MRRARKRRQPEELGEPEILPMMNVLFMLVLALMGMSTFLPLGVVETQAPRISGGKAAATKKQGANLRIMLLKSGINISVNGAVLRGANKALFPKIRSDDKRVYNFAGLQKKLTELKQKYPKEMGVMIMADPDVIYDDIIQTMDASRTSLEGKLLFPEVAFIPGVIR